MAFAAHGKQTRRQRTVEVAGRKLRVLSRNRNYSGNHVGFKVKVTDLASGEEVDRNLFILDRESAEENAVARFLGVGPGAIE